MKRAARSLCLLALAVSIGLLCSQYAAVADQGGFRKELAYGLTLFDGAQYQGTFCSEEIDTVYMLAGVGNVVTPRVTEVYFWPITGEYMADWMAMNEAIEGTLEILDGSRIVTSLALTEYTLIHPTGFSGAAEGLIIGEAAGEAVNDYKNALSRYFQAAMEYGDAVSECLPPVGYTREVDRGFIVNLPPGAYMMRFRGSDGSAPAEGVKRLVVFPALGEGLGYEIIPEDKWTYPMSSDELGESIFGIQSHTIYVKPFRQVQYNRRNHIKLTELPNPSSGRGMENQTTWVHVSPMPGDGLAIEIVQNGAVVERVHERPYYVEQRPGYALGYDIVESDPGKPPSADPSFRAYRIKIPEAGRRCTIRLVDESGRVVPGSVRNLRAARQPGFASLLLSALIPLVVGVLVVGRRTLSMRRRISPPRP